MAAMVEKRRTEDEWLGGGGGGGGGGGRGRGFGVGGGCACGVEERFVGGVQGGDGAQRVDAQGVHEVRGGSRGERHQRDGAHAVGQPSEPLRLLPGLGDGRAQLFLVHDVGHGEVDGAVGEGGGERLQLGFVTGDEVERPMLRGEASGEGGADGAGGADDDGGEGGGHRG